MTTAVTHRNRATVFVSVIGACVAALLLPDAIRPASTALLDSWPRVHVALATFAALCVQALPMILVGSAVSATVAIFMTPQRWARVLPAHPVGGVVVAAVAGMFVPTCECSSVVLARRMMASGVRPEAAVTFMIAAPSFNPLVLWATFLAFGGAEMAGARLLAALIAVVTVGAVVATRSRMIAEELFGRDHHDSHHIHAHEHSHAESIYQRWVEAARHDAVGAATFLVIGGAIAAVGSAVLPASVIAEFSENVWISVILMATVAVVASLCSLGDSFVAASLVGLHPAAMLTFMVVGPIIDLKLAAMMEGILGHRVTRLVASTGLAAGIGASLIAAFVLGWL